MRRPEPGNAVYIIYGYYPGLRSPHRVFLRSFREKRSFFEKKRKPCLGPHARGFLFCVLILYGVRVFEILRFFMKTPGWVINGGALEPESENTFRLQSPSVLLRDMSAKALFKKKGLCDMHRFSVVFIEGKIVNPRKL